MSKPTTLSEPSSSKTHSNNSHAPLWWLVVGLSCLVPIPAQAVPLRSAYTQIEGQTLTLTPSRSMRIARRTARKPKGPVNLNSATVAQLKRLPRIGKRKAERILALRKELGGRFTSLSQLTRVRGIGKRTLARLRPHLTLGKAGRVARTQKRFLPSGVRAAKNSREAMYAPYAPEKSVKRWKRRRGNCWQRWQRNPKLGPNEKVLVNLASFSRLRKLPCIGKKRAQSIIAMRTLQGPYRQPKDLRRVSGIGRKTLAWLTPLVQFKIDLNKATLQQLEALRPLNHGLGEAIFKYRRKRRRFRRVSELLKVPGLGRATYEQIKDLFFIGSTRRAGLPLAMRARPLPRRTRTNTTKTKARTKPKIIVID